MKRFLSLIAVVAISQVRAAEFNWPHYRGPDYNGVSLETGLRDVPEPQMTRPRRGTVNFRAVATDSRSPDAERRYPPSG